MNQLPEHNQQFLDQLAEKVAAKILAAGVMPAAADNANTPADDVTVNRSNESATSRQENVNHLKKHLGRGFSKYLKS